MRAIRQREELRLETRQAVSPEDIERIERTYAIPDPKQVRALLAHRPDAIAVLLEAPERIRQTFSSRLRGIVLETVHDPEEGESLLAATALVRGSARETFEMRECLDRWWMTQTSAVRLAVALSVVPV